MTAEPEQDKPVEPEKVTGPDFENDIYPPPDGISPSEWAGWGVPNQRAYWRAIENTKKITGGQ